MSLTKEVAHELRAVTTQPTDLAVLPSWAKVLPILFYVAFAGLVLGITYNNFQIRLFSSREAGLNSAISQYQEILDRDKQTTSRLVQQRNAAVKVARWVDYSPMIQKILVGLFSPLDTRVQITGLKIERKQSNQPEYALDLSFYASQGDISFVIKQIRDSLLKYGWQLTTVAQVYQQNVTNFQGYLQPVSSTMPFESQLIPVLQDPSASTPEAPTGVSQ